MKKTISTITLLAFGLIGFAQNQFTETTFNDMTLNLEKNPVEAIKKYAHPSFTFINGRGERKNFTDLLNYYIFVTESVRNCSDLKFNQVGNMAIVTGVVEQQWYPKNDASKVSKYMGVFTYTYALDNSKWLLTSAQHTDMSIATEIETAAIRKVIKNETDGFYEGNFDKANGQWATKLGNEYQNQYIAQFVGKTYAKAETLQKLFEFAKKSSQKQEVTVDESDFELRLNKNMAWATYNQKVTKKDGTAMQNQRQTRILERINGEWKIVFVSGQDIK